MNTQPARMPWYVGILALLAAVGVAALLALAAFLAAAVLLGPAPAAVRESEGGTQASALEPTEIPQLWPMAIAPDGTVLSENALAGDVEMAHKAWLSALLVGDVAIAMVIYDPDHGDDEIAEVADHIAVMRSALMRPDPDPLGLGDMRDLRVAGDYGDPHAPSVRYVVSRVIFTNGEVCFRAAMYEDAGSFWRVRAWDTITAAECADALAKIAAR